jgi:hypothetical protein
MSIKYDGIEYAIAVKDVDFNEVKKMDMYFETMSYALKLKVAELECAKSSHIWLKHNIKPRICERCHYLEKL